MASRNFCDWCDTEIKSTSAYFTVEFAPTNVNEDGYSYSRRNNPTFYEGGREITIGTTANMVCIPCATELHKTVMARIALANVKSAE